MKTSTLCIDGWIGAVLCVLVCAGRPTMAAVQASGYELSGYVVDAETGAALAGATVLVSALNLGAVSDRQGYYRLELPPGSYSVRYAYIGFAARELEVDIRASQRIDVALRPALVELGAVQVEALRPLETEDEATMQAVVVPVADLLGMPSFLGEVDVLKALQLLPGVQSGTEGSTGLYVRGGSPDQNLILLDGTPIYNPAHIFGFLSVFNADALEDVRLIKGGFPARYGGRLSSVVEIGMKDGNMRRFESDGTLGLVFSSLTLQGPIARNRASFIVSARRTYIDVLARPFLNRRLPAGQKLTSFFYDLNARWSFVPSARDRLTLSLYGGQDVYGSSYEERTVRDGGEHLDRNEGAAGWGNRALTLRWHRKQTERLHGVFAVSLTDYRLDVDSRFDQFASGAPPIETSERVHYASGITDIAGRADVVYRVREANTIRAGASLVRHTFEPGVSEVRLKLADAGLTDTVITTGVYGFSGVEGYSYVEDVWRLHDHTQVNLGVHASFFLVQGRTYASLQPRLALAFEPTPYWKIDASYGTMRQYVHLLTQTGINLPTDLWLAATDRIKPQRAWQTAFGIERTGLPGDLSVGLEAYYKEMSGLIEYLPGATVVSPDRDWQSKVAVGRGWASGVEFLVRKRRGRTAGWLGYTLSWSRRRFPDLNEGKSFPYRYDRRHDLSIALTQTLGDGLDMGIVWVYGTGQAITLAEARFAGSSGSQLDALTSIAPYELQLYGPRGGYRMAPYHRLDASLNWRFDAAPFSKTSRSSLSIGAYNAYNRRNPFYLFVLRGPGGERRYRQASLFPVLPYVSYRFHY